MKKLFTLIWNTIFNLFATKKQKEKRVLSQAEKRLTQVLVKKEKSKSEMIAWLKKKCNNGSRFNTHHKVKLLKQKFGQELQDQNLQIKVEHGTISLQNARI